MRICSLALGLLLVMAGGPAAAQDIGLALERGLSDLALFTLAQSERQVSRVGYDLLALQGFLHDPRRRRLQPLSKGQALVPVLRHDDNVNDGIPAERITLGGIPFIVTEDSRAKDAVLLGVQYSRWANFSYNRGSRVRFAQSYTAELEPTYGYHRLAASARICAEQTAMHWTWIDVCLTGMYDDDSVEADTSLTASFGARKLFASGTGFHQASASLARAATEDYDKDILKLGLETLTMRHGLIGVDVTLGKKIAGENTLLHLVGVNWTGRISGRTVSVGITHARTGGASIFGVPREDRITRVSMEVPMGRVDLGGYGERRRSTIDAYDRTAFGVTVAFRMDLLKAVR